MRNLYPSSPATHSPKLLQSPFRRWMLRYVKVQDASRPDLHDNQHIDKPKCGRHDHKEVRSNDRVGMIPHKSHPTLRWNCRSFRILRHVPAYRARGDLNANLQQKFVGNPFLSPSRIVCRHFQDQLPEIGRNTRAATRARLPLPKQPKSLPMPTDQSVGLNDCQSLSPFKTL